MVQPESDSDTDSSLDSHDSAGSSEDAKSSTSSKSSQDVWRLAARMRKTASADRMTGVSKPTPRRKRHRELSPSSSPPPKKKKNRSTARSQTTPSKKMSHRLSVRLAYLWLKGEKRNTLGLHTRIINFKDTHWFTELLTDMYEQFRVDAEGRFPPLELQNRGKNPLPALPPFNPRWVRAGTGIAPFEGEQDLRDFLDHALSLGGLHHAKDFTIIFKTHTYLEDTSVNTSYEVASTVTTLPGDGDSGQLAESARAIWTPEGEYCHMRSSTFIQQPIPKYLPFCLIPNVLLQFSWVSQSMSLIRFALMEISVRLKGRLPQRQVC